MLDGAEAAANGFLNATSIKLIFVEDCEMMNEQISGDSPIVNGKSFEFRL